ncbi:hypothetical protein [Streptacidiphilus melanogenes]|uniref:hypothetical protein n=1 Tax=Streptacidiphilus melanogenes TaxID=411235 RepID=UPI0005A8B4DF|nr:hypothetical protein [Streptacidiphilus melanogenes]
MSGQKLPTDEAELYRAFLRGAVPFRPYSAAVDLVFRVPELRQWMIDGGFAYLREDKERPTAEIDFKAATDRVREAVASGSFESEFPPGDSCRAALWLAASLAGVPHLDPLRFFVEALSADHAKLCAEAVMYAADFMDGTADPSGGLDDESMGPREELFDKICWE